jgi:hypothetical protein
LGSQDKTLTEEYSQEVNAYSRSNRVRGLAGPPNASILRAHRLACSTT